LPPFGNPPSLPLLNLGCLNPAISSTEIAIRIRDALRKLYNQLLPIGIANNVNLPAIPPESSPLSLEDLTDRDRISPVNKADFQDQAVKELQIQKEMEQRWQNLVRSMAADCIPFENSRTIIGDATPITSVGVFGITTQVLNEAIRLAGSTDISALQIFKPLPTQYEDGIQNIVTRISQQFPQFPPGTIIEIPQRPGDDIA
jgi:hypothetical protein